MSKDEITRRDGEQGPVSVADLLAQHQGPDRGGTDPAREATSHHHEPDLVPTPRAGEIHSAEPADPGPTFVTELLRREGRAEEEPSPVRPSRMYRAVAVLAGFVLLCGAVTAGTAALSGPRAERAVPSPVAVKAITGAEALQPDLLSSGGEIGRPPPGPDGDPRAPGTSRNPPSHGQAPRSLPQADPAAAGELALPPPPTTGQAPHKDSRDGADPDSAAVVNLVNTFYQTATVSPRDAFELLSPPLQGQGYLVFRQAWAGVRRATVEDIQQDGPSAALVSVRLEQQDSSVLHTRQHVLIIPGVAPRIAEVALLSASRS